MKLIGKNREIFYQQAAFVGNESDNEKCDEDSSMYVDQPIFDSSSEIDAEEAEIDNYPEEDPKAILNSIQDSIQKSI